MFRPWLLLVFVPLGLLLAQDANNLLTNGNFEDGKTGWGTFCQGGTVELTGDGPEAQSALTFHLDDQAAERRFSFHFDTDLSLTERYRLQFWARADQKASVLIVPQKSVPNYEAIGGGSTVTLGPEWKRHTVELRVKDLYTEGRVNFLAHNPVPAGRIQFAKFVLEVAP